ncbi:MAG: bifunctional chorismate mutase/prephenate dehydratase [Butyricicoccus sp.]
MRELPEIRQDINRVDSAIRELFLLRMSLALEVAKTKAQSDDKIYKPDREAEIVEKRSAGMEEELQLKYVSLLQSMIRASREYQYSEILRQVPEKFPFKPSESLIEPKTVFYQGVPGAYQELAACALFPSCEPQNVPTWEQVFQSVRDGKADIGVVPVENTTAGTVSEVYDLLLDYDLYINRSYIKKISHCLAAVPGTKLEDVKRVCSHPHALPQCHSLFRARSGGHRGGEHRHCAQNVQQRATRASLPSARRRRLCATPRYSRRGHQRHAAQRNTLYRRQQNADLPAEDNRIEIAFHIPNASGTLITVLDTIAHYGIDMTEIHSRPLKDSPWCYVFYVDFTGNMRDHVVQSPLYQPMRSFLYQVIGSYCVPNE